VACAPPYARRRIVETLIVRVTLLPVGWPPTIPPIVCAYRLDILITPPASVRAVMPTVDGVTNTIPGTVLFRLVLQGGNR